MSDIVSDILAQSERYRLNDGVRELFNQISPDYPRRYQQEGAISNVRFFLKENPADFQTLSRVAFAFDSLGYPIFLNGFGLNPHDDLDAACYIEGYLAPNAIASLEVALSDPQVATIFRDQGVVWLEAGDWVNDCQKRASPQGNTKPPADVMTMPAADGLH